MRWQHRLERSALYGLLTLISASILYPIVLIFISSLKTTKDFMGNPIGLPDAITLQNYVRAWQESRFDQYYGNSLIISIMSVAGIAVFGSMAAYALGKKFRGSEGLFKYFLIGLMIPAQATIITTFVFLKQVHLLSTFTGLILVYISHLLPLAIFIFTGFFKTIPRELEEAALLDGCGDMGIFWKIIMPVSRPVIATVVILTGMTVWNDFFLPLILMLDQAKHPLPVGLLRLKGEFSVNWPLFFAAMSMLITPMILLFLFMQKHFINGLTSGAVKG